MFLLEKIDQIGKPAWIALTIVGFWLAWPLGLATLAFAGLSGRIFRLGCAAPGRWYNTENAPRRVGCGWRRRMRHDTSGNAAFDDYRAETLRRLEDEQHEFLEYLERLRRAKDREEFDRFMAERRDRPEPTEPPEPA
ncbi:MAG TPA: DUF2852 domain-containing protein [Acetobacteraceae bacterium]|nr:DUF2852 domain-containing protein [Acetobacteraceae bacterium]